MLFLVSLTQWRSPTAIRASTIDPPSSLFKLSCVFILQVLDQLVQGIPAVTAIASDNAVWRSEFSIPSSSGSGWPKRLQRDLQKILFSVVDVCVLMNTL